MRTHDPERLLPAATSMAAPTLRVADLERTGAYYADAFDLQPLEERAAPRGPTRVLGRGDVPMMRLVSEPDLPVPSRREAGLFHTAFVFDTPAGLAHAVVSAAQHPATRFTGAADHLVSIAFYFTDPEGNGVELYWDRPRSTWRYDHGQIVVGTDPLDARGFLQANLAEPAAEDRAGRVGHVHLQVGDIATASPFYVGALGFEITQSRHPGALFVSAGGYHHHVAVNTWHSRGAGPRAAALGLAEMAIALPDDQALDALRGRLKAHRIAFADDGRTVAFDDPWRTRLTASAHPVTTDALLA